MHPIRRERISQIGETAWIHRFAGIIATPKRRVNWLAFVSSKNSRKSHLTFLIASCYVSRNVCVFGDISRCRESSSAPPREADFRRVPTCQWADPAPPRLRKTPFYRKVRASGPWERQSRVPMRGVLLKPERRSLRSARPVVVSWVSSIAVCRTISLPRDPD